MILTDKTDGDYQITTILLNLSKADYTEDNIDDTEEKRCVKTISQSPSQCQLRNDEPGQNENYTPLLISTNH